MVHGGLVALLERTLARVDPEAANSARGPGGVRAPLAAPTARRSVAEQALNRDAGLGVWLALGGRTKSCAGVGPAGQPKAVRCTQPHLRVMIDQSASRDQPRRLIATHAGQGTDCGPAYGRIDTRRYDRGQFRHSLVVMTIAELDDIADGRRPLVASVEAGRSGKIQRRRGLVGCLRHDRPQRRGRPLARGDQRDADNAAVAIVEHQRMAPGETAKGLRRRETFDPDRADRPWISPEDQFGTDPIGNLGGQVAEPDNLIDLDRQRLARRRYRNSRRCARGFRRPDRCYRHWIGRGNRESE